MSHLDRPILSRVCQLTTALSMSLGPYFIQEISGCMM
uniref:Uncharacterized protein n=1 Tax=Anguilla anguilla TaxID=7936 RepID=A0A0E9TN90_ANGAN